MLMSKLPVVSHKRPLSSVTPTSDVTLLRVKLGDNGLCSGDVQIIKKPKKPESSSTLALPPPPVFADSNQSIFSATSLLDDFTLGDAPLTHFNKDNFNQIVDMATSSAAASMFNTYSSSAAAVMVVPAPAAVPVQSFFSPIVSHPSTLPSTSSRAPLALLGPSARYLELKTQMDEDFKEVLNISLQLGYIRTYTKGCKQMHLPSNTQIATALRPQDAYIKMHTFNRESFLTAMTDIGTCVVGKRYFISHSFSTVFSPEDKRRELDFIFCHIIYFLSILSVQCKNGMLSIKNASVLFVTDCRSKYEDLHSLFVNNAAWEKDQKKNVSSYFICTKSLASQSCNLSEEDRARVAASERQLSKLESKFEDLTTRYVVVITSYPDTVSLFRNLGKFRKHRFANMFVLHLNP